jgi:hypothetical protein
VKSRVKPANKPISDWKAGRTLITQGYKELKDNIRYKEFIKMERISIKGCRCRVYKWELT